MFAVKLFLLGVNFHFQTPVPASSFIHSFIIEGERKKEERGDVLAPGP